MPYTKNGEQKIYYETTGEGPPLLLHHGLTESLESWKRFKYMEALSGKYQVILMDARGHGNSDKPHEPEKYSMKHMTGDVAAVLDDLGVEKANFWGYSMGGRVGLALGRYHPDRFKSVIVGGNGLVEKDSKDQVEELQGYIKLLRQGMDAVIASLGDEQSEDMNWFRDQWRRNDLDALIGYCSLFENIGMAEYLPGLDTPHLLYAGSLDVDPHRAAKACAKVMKIVKFFSLPGLDHMGAFMRSPVVLPRVIDFLIQVNS